MNKIFFKNKVHAALFECELKGQISDGHWENTPGTDWEKWCSAEVLVGEPVGRNFHPRKDNFNISSAELLTVIGGRMRTIARLAIAGYTFDEINLLEGLFDIEFGTWDGPQSYMKGLEKFNLEKVRTGVESIDYPLKQLRADLKEMKTALRTHINVD